MTTHENELESPAKNPEASSDAKASPDAKAPKNDSETPREKPEPDEAQKEKAAEMMKAYEDRPTLVLPGTGGTVSGTAVNKWLDEDGNPKAAGDENAPAAKAKFDEGKSSDDESGEGLSPEEQVEKDKAFNNAVIEASKHGPSEEEEEERAKAARQEQSVTR